MAEKPISTPLPADLPTNWQTGQTVSPTGTEVGLTQQHGYNYQAQQINNAQTAINTINEAFENVYGDGNTVPVADGGTGATTPQEALVNLGAASNPNLLDNWYFVGGGSQQGGGQFPINQRGKTSYTGAGYGIDRWTQSNPSCAVNINSSGVSFSSTSEDGFMAQFIENPKVIHGKITLSVLSESSNVYATARIIVFYNGEIADLAGEHSNLSICSINLDDYDNITNIEFRIGNLSAGQSTTLIAAKLELGPVQTLAHQDADGNWVLNDPPPNFQQELAKCQRYYQLYSSTSIRPSNGNDCRPVMRLSTPTQGTIQINQTTWYYNDASL